MKKIREVVSALNGSLKRTGTLLIVALNVIAICGLFSIAAATTVAPTLKAPKNGKENVPTSNVTFKWKASPKATNYRIVISQDSAFSGFYDNNGNSSCTNGTCFTTTTGTATSYSKSMSLGGQAYYWKVRANGPDGASSWSETFSFRTTKTKAPTLTTPANHKKKVPSSNVTFSWRPSKNANNYRIVISQDSSFSGFYDNNEYSSCNGTCFTTATGSYTSYSKSMSMSGQTYYWKVRANGPDGVSDWSGTRDFTTAP